LHVDTKVVLGAGCVWIVGTDLQRGCRRP